MLKQAIKNRYYKLREKAEADAEATVASKKFGSLTKAMVRHKLKMPREDFVHIVEDAIEDINLKNRREPYISDGFRLCGLNPWSQEASLSMFKNHLDKLEENKILNSLVQNQTALKLG